MKIGKKLCIIVPCYNEEAVLKDTASSLLKVLDNLKNGGKVSAESGICFVDDGSIDKTWSIIEELHQRDNCLKGIHLSRNFGHQGALLAGLYSVDADVFVTIDADLQDDELAIIEMIDRYNEGCDIVYGVRGRRDADSFFKRATAMGFYRVMQLLGVRSVYNHADFRLMSCRAVDALKSFPEKNLFLRAMVPLLGFPSAQVLYDRKPREKGESKYPLRKMLAFAWDGITSFSVVPLRIVTVLGLITCILSVPLIGYSIFRWIADETVLGWTSLITVVTLFSGVQLISIGIIGEYVGKIYQETKQRPSFIVEKVII